MTNFTRTSLFFRIGLVIVLMICGLSSFVQSQELDIESKEQSILRINKSLKISTSDTAKYFLEKQLYYIYINDDVNKALESALNSLRYAELAGLKGDVAIGYLDIGNAYFKKEEFEKAFENFSLSLKYMQINDLNTTSSLASFHIGVTYLELFLFKSAKELLKSAENEFKTSRNKSLATYELTRLSLLEGDTTLAKDYLTKFEALIPEEDGQINTDYLYHYSVLSELYIGIGKFDKAEEIVYRSLPYIEAHNRRYYRGIVNLNLAKISNHKGNLDQAIEHANIALTFFQLQQENFYTYKTLLFLSELYSANQNFSLAYKALHQYESKRNTFFKARQSAIQTRLIDQINETRSAETKLNEIQKRLTQRKYFTSILSFLLLCVGILALIVIRSSREKAKIAVTISKINADKDHFIGVVSHDLRSPLNSIMGLSSILAEDAKNTPFEEVQEFSSIILSSSHRMEHLINNMLDANKIETGNTKLNIAPILLQDALSAIVDSVLYLGKEKEIETEIFIEDNLPKILGDYDAVQRVIENLISNAYKFSEKNSLVKIKASQQGNQVQVSIKDQGPGMSELDRSKLFRKFEKLSATPTGNEKSTGLGLFIVKNLMVQMNGTILVESELDRGTTFSVLFNIA